MKRERDIKLTLLRCLRLRCPVCGDSLIIQSPFKIRHHCPRCNALYQREDGFFVGAITINVVTTELIILVLYLACLFLLSSFQMILVILFVVGLLFPVAFYHHSWSIWLSLDHLIERLPKYGASLKGKDK
ncbi:MAG: DUF983 domain-containing protein [Pyrinomonadaceae bacterium]|nr:DUF983 domain-containing protein [Pyrinomonadaceae bacterium]